ncbi:unnamed protein product [Blepharisma stoltei]|uniref:Peptidase A1 domain-containing protein n=1 Tax=Blepharisma stoltei TaxID=1481888 RepID=A0AAU9K9U5_9CILI|nr:unnamed protein product [Blepharisma stoltei]
MTFISIAVLLIAASSAYIKIPLKNLAENPKQLIVENYSTNPSTVEWTPTSYLKNYINMQYFAQIYIGSPPQLFNVQISTASPWLWIPSTKCQFSCHKCSNYFDFLLSSSYKLLSQNYKIYYGAGFIRGDLSSESFSIGDNKGLFIKNQTFILVNQDGGFNDAIYDGILGLEYNSQWLKYPTFLDNLKRQGQISRKIFSVFLSDNGFSGIQSDGSAIIFGGFDLESYSENQDIQYVDLLQNNGRWQTSLSELKVDGDQITSRNSEATFGIGIGLMYAPQAEFNSIYKELSDEGDCWIENSFVLCDCGESYKLDDYPEISFVLGLDHKFTLEPQNYFYKYGSKCYLLFGVNPIEYGWIIGDVFMRKYYTIFDADFGRIGLALAKTRKFVKAVDYVAYDKNEANLSEETFLKKSEIAYQNSNSDGISIKNADVFIYQACFLVVFGISISFICCICNRRSDEEASYYEKIYA